jgi:hypothetical protein
MENTLSNETFCEIEKFAKELQECFKNYRKNHSDRFSDIVLDYVNKIINIHLDLTRLKFERGCNEMARAYKEEVEIG